jgi:hypothetical protein
MGLSNLERQQRWQARQLVKLTASAGEIADKLIRMADQDKLCTVYDWIGTHIIATSELEAHRKDATLQALEAMRARKRRVRELEAENAQLRADAAVGVGLANASIRELEEENAKLRVLLEKFRGVKNDLDAAIPIIRELEAENAKLKEFHDKEHVTKLEAAEARIRELEAELARERQANAAKAANARAIGELPEAFATFAAVIRHLPVEQRANAVTEAIDAVAWMKRKTASKKAKQAP